MKVALVHDYLTRFGGAERVVSALSGLWPDAPIYTSAYNPRLVENEKSFLGKIDIEASFLQKVPFKNSIFKLFVPILPLSFESFDLSRFDVVISSGYFSKGVITRPEQIHINYCHTPPRFLYNYPTETKVRDTFWGRFFVKPLDTKLRVWDYSSAHRPDFIVANSENVASRVEKFWRRDSRVIYPPVYLPEDHPSKDDLRSRWKVQTGKYFLAITRLEPYKNIDLAVKACNKLGLPLKVAGTGSEIKRLRKLSGPSVEILGRVPDQELPYLYAGARALIAPAEDEDFGITPVEAMAYGKPVIALRSGGFRETVQDGKTGLFFDEPTVAALVSALEKFDTFFCRPKDCISRAREFSKERFQEEFKSFVESSWKKRKKN